MQSMRVHPERSSIKPARVTAAAPMLMQAKGDRETLTHELQASRQAQRGSQEAVQSLQQQLDLVQSSARPSEAGSVAEEAAQPSSNGNDSHVGLAALSVHACRG